MTPDQLADALEDAVHAVLMHYRIRDATLIQEGFDTLMSRIDDIKGEFAHESPEQV